MTYKLPKYLKKKEALLLLNTPYKTDIRDHMMILTFLKLGVRVSELICIKAKNFDFVERSLLIESGKGKKDRMLFFDMEYSTAAREYMEKFNLGGDDILFNMTRRQVHNIISNYGKKAGLEEKVYPHKLRHTFAVTFLRNGGNLRDLQKTLGHSSLTTTQIYLDITGEDLREGIDRHSVRWLKKEEETEFE